ncbi:MAG: T9SS type A sorting domain-containing protein, partial [Flavisolibacter sp.]
LVTAGTATVWTPQNSGLPNVRTDMLRFRGSDGLLAAATHGRGLFTTNLTLLSTGLPSIPNTKNFIDYVTNTEQQVFVKVGNLTTTSMQVKMYSMDGKLVYSSKTAYTNQSISIARLARGTYVMKIYGNKNEQYTKQLIK